MSPAIAIHDEVTSRLGRPAFVFTLCVAEEQLTTRELIRARVLQEVEAFNTKQAAHFQGLVQPQGAERTAQGYRLREPRPIKADEQCALALAAFEQNGFILLVNDQQVIDLDASIVLAPETRVTFLKLVPLVGG
jgi:hypothetical protein